MSCKYSVQHYGERCKGAYVVVRTNKDGSKGYLSSVNRGATVWMWDIDHARKYAHSTAMRHLRWLRESQLQGGV